MPFVCLYVGLMIPWPWCPYGQTFKKHLFLLFVYTQCPHILNFQILTNMIIPPLGAPMDGHSRNSPFFPWFIHNDHIILNFQIFTNLIVPPPSLFVKNCPNSFLVYFGVAHPLEDVIGISEMQKVPTRLSIGPSRI